MFCYHVGVPAAAQLRPSLPTRSKRNDSTAPTAMIRLDRTIVAVIDAGPEAGPGTEDAGRDQGTDEGETGAGRGQRSAEGGEKGLGREGSERGRGGNVKENVIVKGNVNARGNDDAVRT